MGSPETAPVPRDAGEDPFGRDPCAPIGKTAAAELTGLVRFAVARLGSRSHMAHDVVQQALCIALAHAAPPPAADAQRSWLRGIVRNVIRHDRRALRRGRAAYEGASARLSAAPPSEGSSASRLDEERAWLVHAIFLAVTELDTAEQDLFYAFYRAGRSHASIAAELGTTEKAIEARLYRLRARLRALEPFGVGRTP